MANNQRFAAICGFFHFPVDIVGIFANLPCVMRTVGMGCGKLSPALGPGLVCARQTGAKPPRSKAPAFLCRRTAPAALPTNPSNPLQSVRDLRILYQITIHSQVLQPGFTAHFSPFCGKLSQVPFYEQLTTNFVRFQSNPVKPGQTKSRQKKTGLHESMRPKIVKSLPKQ